MSQANGKTIGGDAVAVTGVSGVTVGLELDGDGGGKVTEALAEGLNYRTSSSFIRGGRLKGG
jgi:hypothetical protein